MRNSVTRNIVAKATAVTLACGLAAGLAGTPAQANAQYTVSEKDGYLNTHIHLNAGESVQISPTSDQIQSGLWFFGWNGPAGYTTKCNSQCPLPDERAYSLLVQIGNQLVYVGSNRGTFTADGAGEVVLKINDDIPGNGQGYFKADVTKV